MRFTEIGQQLRAYRLESGLRAEEIAARLGVSRAALYRYEKGEVIKLDTIKRLAELLKISPLSLLGIGVEYYNRPVGYLERIRQVEVKGLAKLQALKDMTALRDYVDEGPVGKRRLPVITKSEDEDEEDEDSDFDGDDVDDTSDSAADDDGSADFDLADESAGEFADG